MTTEAERERAIAVVCKMRAELHREWDNATDKGGGWNPTVAAASKERMAAIDVLLAIATEREADAKDAARYRWLTEHTTDHPYGNSSLYISHDASTCREHGCSHHLRFEHADDYDTAIDAAIAKGAGEKT